MVKDHPIKVSRDQLKNLLIWAQEQLPNEDPKTLFYPSLWEPLNPGLYNAATLRSPAAAKLLSACRVVHKVVTHKCKTQAESKETILMTKIPEMQATGEATGAGGAQGMSFPPPDPGRVRTKPRKTGCFRLLLSDSRQRRDPQNLRAPRETAQNRGRPRPLSTDCAALSSSNIRASAGREQPLRS